MRRQSPVDDHPPALLASTPPDPLRRPPPGRSGKPRLAPATRRLQENGDPAQDSGDRSPLLGLANQDLDRVEAASRVRYPDTVLRWQRHRFRDYWTKLSSRPTRDRPSVNAEIKALITRMAAANPLWGAPRIHGELLKLGIHVAERT